MKALRMDLNPAEREKSYAKYFDLPMTEPNKALMEILKKGPMDPSKALMPENINDLLNEGYHEVENGYCILENGAAYVAVNNVFPNVTVDMVNWWFAWHALEDMRYMLWFKPGHFGITVSEEDRETILNPNVAMTEKFQGLTHQVVEDTGGGPEDISIRFLKPEEMGFDMNRFKAPQVGTIVAANGLSQNRKGGPKAPAIMCHFVREIEGGVEFRTRFWMGYQMVEGKPVKLLPEGVRIPIEAPMGLAFHNVAEYSHLAAILPGLYKEMGGKVE